MTHYSAELVRDHGVDVGGGWTVAGVLLDCGDTAWNPASTKGPLCGPSMVEYRIHHSGIDVVEVDPGSPCFGGDQLEEWPYWRRCPSQPEPGMTRCNRHSLAHYAMTAGVR
jgi:hypothetical protein